MGAIRNPDFRAAYDVGCMLGSGTYGTVWKCARKDNDKVYACKILAKNKLHADDMAGIELAEAVAMRKVKGHDNVVELVEVFEDADTVYLVMEFCEAGDLADKVMELRQLQEPDAAAIFREVAKAVQFCHAKGVIHRDIKVDNILLGKKKDGKSRSSSSLRRQVTPAYAPCPWAVKLADFGFARVLDSRDEKIRGVAGSKPYEAPEMLRRESYGLEADVWSLGVTLYTMLAGRWPFRSSRSSSQDTKILTGDYDFHSSPWHAVSSEAKDLIRCMLEVDPAKRATAETVLNHPWLVRYCGYCKPIKCQELEKPALSGCSLPCLPEDIRESFRSLSSSWRSNSRKVLPEPQQQQQCGGKQQEERTDATSCICFGLVPSRCMVF